MNGDAADGRTELISLRSNRYRRVSRSTVPRKRRGVNVTAIPSVPRESRTGGVTKTAKHDNYCSREQTVGTRPPNFCSRETRIVRLAAPRRRRKVSGEKSYISYIDSNICFVIERRRTNNASRYDSRNRRSDDGQEAEIRMVVSRRHTRLGGIAV